MAPTTRGNVGRFLSTEGGELSLAIKGGLDGNADGSETLPSECGGEGNPAVNGTFLRDALNATTGEFVEIRHSLGGQHIFVLDPSDAGFNAVIMSLR